MCSRDVKIRIAVWHNLPSGGGKRALYYHVKGLIERGHEVEAWCPPMADQGYLPLGEMIVEHVVPLDRSIKGSRSIIGRALIHYQDTLSRLEAMEQHCIACAEEIARGQFDMLLAHPCKLLRVTAIGRYVHIPRVVYIQEPYRPLYEAMPRLPWLAWPAPKNGQSKPRYAKAWLRNLVEVQGLRVQAREELNNAQAYDTILVNSMFSRESVLRAYGLDAKVCYLGVDTEKFTPCAVSKENSVVGVGAFVPEKNIEFVIQSLALVSQPRPSLVWVGNVTWPPTYRDELLQLAKSLGVEFQAYEQVNDLELIDILRRARMMVYAPRLEPFGYAPLEANACGIPVVAVAEGGVRETVIDGVNGLLVEHDSGAFAAAIQRLLDDMEYCRQLGVNGSRLVAEKWSLTNSIDRLEQRLMETRTAVRHHS